jgi:hypothetical protein
MQSLARRFSPQNASYGRFWRVDPDAVVEIELVDRDRARSDGPVRPGA